MKGPNELSKGPTVICDDSKINQENLISKSVRLIFEEVYLCLSIVKIKCLLNKMGRVPCMQPIPV